MRNRIDLKFQELKVKRKKAFIVFITAGFPNLKMTENLVLGLEEAGVDIIELGVPFSDPLADGPTIQESSQKALRGHVTLDKILHTVRNIRKKSSIPIALMSYYNPIFRYGENKFVINAKEAGVDGLIVPDLPLEEAKGLIKAAKRYHMAMVFFLSPTTTTQRIKKIVRASTGFIYYVSLTGVTGARSKLPRTITQNVRFAKQFTDKPICVGFGVSTPHQVKTISSLADGVIVGSAIIKEITKNIGKKDLSHRVTRFVRGLSNGL